MKRAQLPNDMQITGLKPRPVGGTWARGTIGGFRFDALVWPGHADNPDWEIDNSRITKLTLRQSQNDRIAYSWDRGLDIAAKGDEVSGVLARLTDVLAAHVFDDVSGWSDSLDREPVTSPTPGPYAYIRGADGCDDFWYIVPANNCRQVLASILFWDDDNEWMAQSEANARLLAAAPELLEAVRDLLTIGPDDAERHHAAVDRAWAVIADVKGRG